MDIYDAFVYREANYKLVLLYNLITAGVPRSNRLFEPSCLFNNPVIHGHRIHREAPTAAAFNFRLGNQLPQLHSPTSPNNPRFVTHHNHRQEAASLLYQSPTLLAAFGYIHHIRFQLSFLHLLLRPNRAHRVCHSV